MLVRDVLLTLGGTIVSIIFYKIYKVWDRLHQKVNDLSTILQLVENSRDITYYCEIKPKFQYRYLSSSIEKILSPSLVEESMKNPYTAFERVHPDDFQILMKKISGELDYSKPILVRWKNDEGKYIWFEEYATPIYENGELVALQGIIRNIDKNVALQNELEYKVSHDKLTGVYNREFFELQIEKYDRNKDVSIAIVICDLDELKFINDNYGHKSGDHLIKETAELLKGFSSDEVIITRIGGDEFAILLVNTEPSQIEMFLKKMQNKIEFYNNNNTTLFKIKMSKGYAFNYSSLGKMEELFIEADNNMYNEKNKKGTNRFKHRVGLN